MNTDNPKVILPLLALTIATQLFLFTVAQTGASFSGQETPVADIFAPAHISAKLDQTLSVISDNLAWSISTASQAVKPHLAAFFGLDNYQFAKGRSTALASQASLAVNNLDVGNQPKVLGAFYVNPGYQQ